MPSSATSRQPSKQETTFRSICIKQRGATLDPIDTFRFSSTASFVWSHLIFSSPPSFLSLLPITPSRSRLFRPWPPFTPSAFRDESQTRTAQLAARARDRRQPTLFLLAWHSRSCFGRPFVIFLACCSVRFGCNICRLPKKLWYRHHRLRTHSTHRTRFCLATEHNHLDSETLCAVTSDTCCPLPITRNTYLPCFHNLAGMAACQRS